MRSAFLACLGLCLLWRAAPCAAQQSAQEQSAEDSTVAPIAAPAASEATSPDVRVAVLLLPTGEADAETADALTELLIATIAGRGATQIVGKEEVQAQLGQGDEGTVECIESAACLGRIGVQLDVREIIAGTLARRDGGWAFNLNRLDVRSGEVLGRAFREVDGDMGELVTALEEALPELWASRVVPARLVVSAIHPGAAVALDGAAIGLIEDESLRIEQLEPGPHEIRVSADGYLDFVRRFDAEPGASILLDATLVAVASASWEPSPLVFVGAGVAVAALAVAIGLGVSSQSAPDASLSMRETITSFYPARETEALAANVLFGVAGAGAILGVVGLALSGEGEPAGEAAASATLRVVPAGTGLILEGSF